MRKEPMKKILILDDEILCDLVERVIESPNRVFFSAKTVSKARTILATEKVDLVLLDPNIQNGVGMALLEDLKHHIAEFRGHPQTIVMSATSGPHSASFKKEEFFFLPKPFQISQLRLLVQNVLNQTEVE